MCGLYSMSRQTKKKPFNGDTFLLDINNYLELMKCLYII